MAISKTQQFFEQLWYRPTAWWLWLFLPIHWLLKVLIWLRRKFYQWGLLNSTKLKIPVIVIGNINVGGTGKTPLAIYLLQWLQRQGFKPGLVTRGYGGDSSLHPLVVGENSKVSEVGDEPFLIFKRSQAVIVADYQRARGAQKLIDDFQCDIILCDDGLQHYALQRDIEILVIDKKRGFGNSWLMPFGPLRETPARADYCDIKVINGDNMELKLEAISNTQGHKKTSDELQRPLTAVAAIGHPERFFSSLAELKLSFKPVPFPDHHKFIADDFAPFPADIIMTEKDAVKCAEFADARFHYLPVSVELDESVLALLHNKIQSLESHDS